MTATGTGPIRQRLIALLAGAGDAGIDADELERRVYGVNSRNTRYALHVALHHLKQARPDLQVEKRHRYRAMGAPPP
jgi:DICT domain-containing protein